MKIELNQDDITKILVKHLSESECIEVDEGTRLFIDGEDRDVVVRATFEIIDESSEE